MRYRYLFSILFILLTVALPSWSQVTVSCRLGEVAILIGEQTTLTLSAHVNNSSTVVFPSFQPGEQIVPGVEVLHQQDVDSITADPSVCQRSRIYTLTSFDGKLYALPPMKIKIDGKVFTSNKLALKVVEVEVDTLHTDKFFPPNDVQDNPFLWSEWTTPLTLSVLVLVMLCLLLFCYQRLVSGKPIIYRRPEKKLPPHQKAMKAIERIKESHLSTSENSKEYYTQLTDALRRYIEERYNFNAMEMTSSEIISQLLSSSDPKQVEELRELFVTADLVKFAKYSTLINENDKNLLNAIEFINVTKSEQPVEPAKPMLTIEEKEHLQKRNKLSLFMFILGIVAIILIVLLVIEVYQNLF